MKIPRSRLGALLLVLAIVASTLGVPRASAITYAPAVLPGDQSLYGQVSAYWSSWGYTGHYNPLPRAIAPFLNVSSVALVVENVSGSSLLEAQTFSYPNGTNRHDSVIGDLSNGAGNLTIWTITKGLRPGDHVYNAPNAPMINETISKSFAGLTRWVNVLNETFVNYPAHIQAVFLWDNQTGILLQYSYRFSADQGVDGSAQGSASVVLTQTDLWSDHPDFKINSESLIPTAGSGSSENITVTVTSLGTFAQAVQLTTTPPQNLTVSQPTPASVDLSGSASRISTIEFSVPLTAKEGNYVLSLQATSGLLSHIWNFTIRVKGDFNISTDVQSITIQSGSSGTFSLFLKSLGLNGAATLASAIQSGSPLAVGFDQSQPTLTPGQTVGSIVTISARDISVSTTYMWTYTVMLTAQKGSVTHSIFVNVNVIAKPHSSILGLDSPVFYGIIAAAGAGAVGGAILVRRRRNGAIQPRESSPPKKE